MMHDASRSLRPDEIELPGANKSALEESQNGLSSDEKAERAKKLLLPSNIYRPQTDLTRTLTLRSCDARCLWPVACGLWPVAAPPRSHRYFVCAPPTPLFFAFSRRPNCSHLYGALYHRAFSRASAAGAPSDSTNQRFSRSVAAEREFPALLGVERKITNLFFALTREKQNKKKDQKHKNTKKYQKIPKNTKKKPKNTEKHKTPPPPKKKSHLREKKKKKKIRL